MEDWKIGRLEPSKVSLPQANEDCELAEGNGGIMGNWKIGILEWWKIGIMDEDGVDTQIGLF